MVCPICGKEMADGMTICSNCGFNYANMLKVSPDKVIAGQSVTRHMAEGDDTVTQLIPENYMSTQGDDSVTQLIPENQNFNNRMAQNMGYYQNNNQYNTQVPAKKGNYVVPIIIGATTAIVVAGIVLLLVLL